MTSQLQSPLLRLPAELRNQIYDEVLHTVTLQGYESADEASRESSPSQASPKLEYSVPQPPALLLVCRQIYHESRLFVSDFTTLVIKDVEAKNGLNAHVHDFRKYIEGMSKFRGRLTSVRVLETQSAFAQSIEDFHRWSGVFRDETARVSDQARCLFPALEIIMVPNEKYRRPCSESAIHFAFSKPELQVLHIGGTTKDSVSEPGRREKCCVM